VHLLSKLLNGSKGTNFVNKLMAQENPKALPLDTFLDFKYAETAYSDPQTS